METATQLKAVEDRIGALTVVIADETTVWKNAATAEKAFYEKSIDSLRAEKAALLATFNELVLIKARADALAAVPAPGKNAPSRRRR